MAQFQYTLRSSNRKNILCAPQQCSVPGAIGDLSTNYCLPLTATPHEDIKAITAATLARVMNGEFNDRITSFKLIDCRYPYEFEGGHINGAVNIYTNEQCLEQLLRAEEIRPQDLHHRPILIFYCEFSSRRAPSLYRFLRMEDRKKNEDTYPLLQHPEMYLLDGGYKNFFQKFSNMCIPVAYKPMLGPRRRWVLVSESYENKF